MWDSRREPRELAPAHPCVAPRRALAVPCRSAAPALVELEYRERAHAALEAADAALEHWDDYNNGDNDDDASTQYAPFDIAAWVKNTNESLGIAIPAPADVRSWFWHTPYLF